MISKSIWFFNMYAKTQGTIIIISHQERILDIADKVVMIEGGRVAAVGAKADVLPKLLGSVTGCRFTEGTDHA